MIKRALYQKIVESKKSVLLLGPRQTGKSTLLQSISPELTINLSNESTYVDFLRNTDELESLLKKSKPKTVLIDEVQRIPSLLNTLQYLIDNDKSVKYYLSGSSARKLHRGSANLLPGRLHSYRLSALTTKELHEQFSVERALKFGSLPGVYLDDDASALKTLRSYTSSYLKEEIQAESLTRNLEGFSRFLAIICAYAGQHIDYSKISKQAQVARTSVVRYVEILEDTLLAETIYAFQDNIKNRLIQHPKIYFFDCGVLNALLENFNVSQDRSGYLFENLVYSQLRASAYAKDKDLQIYSYRTEHNADVDFILRLEGEIFAVEVKSDKNITKVENSSFKSFENAYGKKFKKYVVHRGAADKIIDHIDVVTLATFLNELGL